MRILRLTEVTNKIGLSRSSVYRFIEIGEFPKQIQLSKRTVGWLESDVDAWINAKLGGLNDE